VETEEKSIKAGQENPGLSLHYVINSILKTAFGEC
jgi:hypothetical protein